MVELVKTVNTETRKCFPYKLQTETAKQPTCRMGALYPTDVES